jgi:hypothetical protein
MKRVTNKQPRTSTGSSAYQGNRFNLIALLLRQRDFAITVVSEITNSGRQTNHDYDRKVNRGGTEAFEL